MLLFRIAKLQPFSDVTKHLLQLTSNFFSLTFQATCQDRRGAAYWQERLQKESGPSWSRLLRYYAN